MTINPNVVRNEITELAYRKWVDAECPEGRDWEFWFNAEKEIYEKYNNAITEMLKKYNLL